MSGKFDKAGDGRRRLAEALEQQRLLLNNKTLIETAIDRGQIIEVPSEATVISQDGDDSDIYFIVSGALSVQVNGREVASRSTGTHVGEMALIDPTSKRSADVVSKGHSTLLKIDEPSFSKMAEENPRMWRLIAVELSSRLRERAKFLRRPNDKPMIFIGCSSETLSVANALRDKLKTDENEVKVWTDGVFQASKSALDSLIDTCKAYDFGILILDSNDVVETRGKEIAAPRDNVIFELGLFMGSLGSERTFILSPTHAEIKIPSDLLGITTIQWDGKKLDSSLSAASGQVVERVTKLGPK